MRPLLLALQFLTIIPVTLPRSPTPEDYDRSTAWYPLVGLAIGTPGALLVFGLREHVPSALLTLGVVLIPICLSGALHLDGFADCCDGLFALRSRQERLAILKDSRLGSFGVVGLIALLLTRYVALASLSASVLPTVALLTPCIGRWAIVLGLRWFQPARPGEGLSALFARKARLPFLIATVISTLVLLLLTGIWAFPTLALGALLVLAIGRFATARLGGVTGYVFGAMSECAELAVQLGWAVIVTWR